MEWSSVRHFQECSPPCYYQEEEPSSMVLMVLISAEIIKTVLYYESYCGSIIEALWSRVHMFSDSMARNRTEQNNFTDYSRKQCWYLLLFPVGTIQQPVARRETSFMRF